MRDGKPPSRGREYSLPGHLVHLGWPRIEFEGNIVENDYSRENGLICIEQEYSRKYINPQRGYIRERSERLNGKPYIEDYEIYAAFIIVAHLYLSATNNLHHGDEISRNVLQKFYEVLSLFLFISVCVSEGDGN